MSQEWAENLVTPSSEEELHEKLAKREELLKQLCVACNKLYLLLQEHPEIDLSINFTTALVDRKRNPGVVSKVLVFLCGFSFFQSVLLNVRSVVEAIIVEMKKKAAIAIADRKRLEKL